MFHFSFKIVNIVCEAKSEGWQDPNIYSWRAGSVIASVNSNSINMFIGNGLSTFLIKGKQFFSNDPKVYLKILLIVLFYAPEFLIILN